MKLQHGVRPLAVFLTGLWVCLAGSGAARAEDGQTAAAQEQPEKAWGVDVSTGLYSVYMFRGQKLYDGISIQPSLTGSYDTGYGTLSANLWGHIPGDSDKHGERFSEMDDTITYENTFGPVTVAVGNVWYTYTDYGDGTDIPDSAEVFGSVVLENYINPKLTVFQDYQEYQSTYYELNFSHDFENFLRDKAVLTPYFNAGFGSNAKKYYHDNGLEQITVGAALQVPVGPLSLQPVVNYTFKVDETTVNQLWAGVTLAYAF